MTKRQQALAFFIRQGWTPEQSAGIVANLEAESGLRPDAVGDGGMAAGIAQWHPDRQAGFAGLMGKPIQGSSFEDQLYFVHAELQGAEARAGKALANCATAADAGSVVSRLYERPADTLGEATKRAALAERIHQEWAAQDHAGEAIPVPPIPTQPDAAQPAPAPDSARLPEKPMFPLLLPAILQLIPQLAGIFGKDGSKVQRVGQVAQAVTDVLVQTTGADNLQGAIEKMQADPVAKAEASAAVLQSPPVAALLESQEAGGGGIAGARRAWADPGLPSFWKTGPFWISILLLMIVYAVLADVLFLHPTIWTPSDRSQILMLAVAVTSGVMGYFLGSSIGSAQSKAIALASKY
jgi:Phage tail lysozyme